MKYSKTVRLKDGRTCMIRNGTQQDAQGVWDNFVLTHGETEYLTTYPEEVTFTLEQEEAYLKQKEESDRDAALLAEVDGKVVGFTEYGRNPKSFRSRNSGWQENVLMRLEL